MFADFSQEESKPFLPKHTNSSDVISLKDLESVVASVGGLSWVEALKDTITNKNNK